MGRNIDSKQSERAGSPSLRIVIAGGIIIFAAVAVYHNCFTVPFLLDDVESIAQNSTIRHLWPIWQALSPSAASMVGGRPVVNLSFALNYALGGLVPWGYHVLNLAIHILAGLTLFGVVRRTLVQPALRVRFGPSAARWALAVAVLWTVHPLQTETVTYISQRCESLMGLFYLLTLYCFIRGSDSRRSSAWFALSVVACLLGVASKEVMVTAPVMVFLYDRTFISGNFWTAWTRHRRLYFSLAGTWVLLGCFMVGLHHRGVGYGLGLTWWAYALTECRAMVNYLWLALWPHPLVFDYGRFVAIRHLGEFVPYVLVVAVLIVGAVGAVNRRPAIGFLGAWFFLILAPTSSVVPVAGQPMAEHRMYLPLAAVIVMALVTGNLLCQTLRTRLGWSERVGKEVQTGIVAALAFALGLATIHRNAQYHSAESIWADVVAKRPDSLRGHTNLGQALLTDGRTKEAIAQFFDVLHIDPNQLAVRCNLANALAMSGATNQAVAELQETLRHAPDLALAHVALADILAGQGDQKAALEQYEAGLKLDPNEQAAHFNLAQLLTSIGQREQAVTQYLDVVQLDPRDATAQYNLANLLAESGRATEAIAHYTAAARLDPHNARSQINLGNLFLKQGRSDDAIAAYTDALRADPHAFEAHNNLAVLLAGRGDLPHATEHFREAARLKPDVPEVHSALAEVLERQGLHDEAQRELAEAQRLRR